MKSEKLKDEESLGAIYYLNELNYVLHNMYNAQVLTESLKNSIAFCFYIHLKKILEKSNPNFEECSRAAEKIYVKFEEELKRMEREL